MVRSIYSENWSARSASRDTRSSRLGWRCRGGYHGETGPAGAVGAETSDLSFGYRALLPGFVHVPYPNPYRTPFVARAGGTGDGTVDYIRDHLLFHAIDPREVAGFMIEPVMGSGGCVAPPDSFWPA